MSYFNYDSMVSCKPSLSATKTYNSYIFSSKDSLYVQEQEKYDHFFHSPQEKYIFNKPPPITKLRNILSETISNITKENKLQKGESVELTLEIELMNTRNNTPANSLVEVTIIQHNKTNKHSKNTLVPKSIPFQLDTKSSVSESASQKRRNWFQRVIRRPHEESQLNKDHAGTTLCRVKEYNWKMRRDADLSMKKNSKHNQNNSITIANARSNFVTILPEEQPINDIYRKGYRRVSPVHGTPRNIPRLQRPQNTLTTNKKDSLVKKLSDIFLPHKKESKNKAVRSALNALKNEVDNMKFMSEKGSVITKSRKRKRRKVHNLGKLVSNILVDVMDNSDISKSSFVGKDKSLPVQYQSFFEPVWEGHSKHKNKKLNKFKTNTSKKKTYESHSDTCCLINKQSSSSPNLKSSNSVSNCKTYTCVKTSEEIPCMGDFSTVATNKTNRNNVKKLRKNKKKYEKGDAISQHHHPIETPTAQNLNNNKQLQTKTSIIHWNGKTIEVHKEVKTRIEMLIVNELQNLAIKEGMECDVKPLPSTNDGVKTETVEKMSSFICQLDISDKLINKKRSKTLSNQLHKNQLPPVITKQSNHSLKRTKRKTSKTIRASALPTVHKQSAVRYNCKAPNNAIQKKNEVKRHMEKKNISVSQVKEIEQNDIQVTYLNMNVKNWSAESNSVLFESPRNKELQGKKIRSPGSPVFHFSGRQELDEDKDFDKEQVASGFVKRIASDDSVWNKYLSGYDATEKTNSTQENSKQLVTVTSTKTEVKLNSSASNDCASSIEIELDIKDLELIIKEAKERKKANKVLITAKCKSNNKKQKKEIKFTGKNSSSYTNQLLSHACQKLEKYAKRKQ